LPYSPINKPQRLVHPPLSGGIEDGDQTFTNKVGVIYTTQLKALNTTMKLYTTKIKLRDDLFYL
jgi:hypothetical protein